MPWIDNPGGFITPEAEFFSAEFLLGEAAVATTVTGASLLALGGIAAYEGYEYIKHRNDKPARPAGNSKTPKPPASRPKPPSKKSDNTLKHFGPHYVLYSETERTKAPPIYNATTFGTDSTTY